MLTDGLTQGRLQVSGWLIAEDRDTPYDWSVKTPNPLQERTRVRVYLVTGDLRIGDLYGVQVTATVPDVTRSAVDQARALRELEGAARELREVAADLSDLTRRIARVAKAAGVN